VARSSALLVLLAASPALAAPSGWAASFSPDAVRQSFGGGPVAVVAGSPSAAAPAAALLDALKKASVQASEGPRAPASGWSDERAVEAAVRSGAAQIAVVRVYPGAGGPTVCTVAVYGRDKSPLRAFYVPLGQAAVRAPALPSSGASPVEDVARYRNVDEAFVRSHFVDFDEHVALRDGVKVAEYAVPFLGEQKKFLWWDEFYKTVGRDDLAAQSASLGKLKISLAIGALGCVVGTFVGGFITYATLSATYSPGIVGPVLAVGGVVGATVLGLWSANLQPMVTNMEENRRLADEYNQRLKRGEVHAGLTLLPGGAGFALAASF